MDPMSLPPAAAWRHQEARAGFEVAFFHTAGWGLRISGTTSAVEDDQAWVVDYIIEVDDSWTTRRAYILTRSASETRSVAIDADGRGHWLVDGQRAPQLDGCLDVDLEASALTNALPVHRLGLAVGVETSAPAAYVRVLTPAVERLEQRYTRAVDDGSLHRYDYVAPAFDFTCRLVYDEYGLVVAYPGIAMRAA